ncbi:MAG: hypothetical protein HYY05_03155 [Chloroflexi bacterium]|nr:hypothetical protein [Chloroflexota bacterium]
MSRLVEQLKRARESSGGSMGFAPRTTPASGPGLVVLAAVEASLAGSLGERLSAQVDAVVLRSEGPSAWAEPEARADLWGVELTSDAAGLLATLRERGCDFLLFAPDAGVELLGEESFGRLLAVDPQASDGELRAMGSLDVDAVVAPLPNLNALTVGDLAALRRVMLLTGRPAILRCAELPAEGLLVPLRDAGVAGLLVDVSGEAALEPLAHLREQAQRLPPPRQRNERLDASPQLGQSGGGARSFGGVRRRPMIPS